MIGIECVRMPTQHAQSPSGRQSPRHRADGVAMSGAGIPLDGQMGGSDLDRVAVAAHRKVETGFPKRSCSNKNLKRYRIPLNSITL
jgi:hypothetical protein